MPRKPSPPKPPGQRNTPPSRRRVLSSSQGGYANAPMTGSNPLWPKLGYSEGPMPEPAKPTVRYSSNRKPGRTTPPKPAVRYASSRRPGRTVRYGSAPAVVRSRTEGGFADAQPTGPNPLMPKLGYTAAPTAAPLPVGPAGPRRRPSSGGRQPRNVGTPPRRQTPLTTRQLASVTRADIGRRRTMLSLNAGSREAQRAFDFWTGQTISQRDEGMRNQRPTRKPKLPPSR